MHRLNALFFFLCFLIPPDAGAQELVDSLFQWRGYIHPGQARIRIYRTAEDEKRPHTIVLEELAQNRGPLVHEDLPYLVEEICRAFGLEAAGAYWVLHWGAFTFGEIDSKKELFLRATFNRSSPGRLGAPQWRMIKREEVEELTDRQFH